MSHVTQPDDPVNLSSSFDDCGDIVISLGLTKREYFAAMAIQGLISTNTEESSYGPVGAAAYARAYADALIAELNK